MHQSHHNIFIIKNSIIGDALGASLNGLTKGHINSSFKMFNDFIDPVPALKGKMDQWNKPGLYSSISQLMILLFLKTNLIKLQNFSFDSFFNLLENLPENDINNNCIFRNPGHTERSLIERIHNKDKLSDIPDIPCARVLPLSLPFSLSSLKPENHIISLLTFYTKITRNPETLGVSLLYSFLVKKIFGKSAEYSSILNESLDSAHELTELITKLTPEIFNLKINADYIIHSFKLFIEIIEEINSIAEIKTAEIIIYKKVNTILKTPVTRATVNHPLLILPFSLYHIKKYGDTPEEILFKTLQEGGSTSILTAITASFSGAIFGNVGINKTLEKNLVNKKRIDAILDIIEKHHTNDSIINQFIETELSLTKKENEERAAKLKHNKKKPQSKKNRNTAEKDLSRHIVESWTKIDKAKWKKEKRKKDDDS